MTSRELERIELGFTHYYGPENCPGKPCSTDCDHYGVPPVAVAHLRRYGAGETLTGAGAGEAFCGAGRDVEFGVPWTEVVNCIPCLRAALGYYVRRGDLYKKALGEINVDQVRRVSIEVRE